jgi:hypothetical protein
MSKKKLPGTYLPCMEFTAGTEAGCCAVEPMAVPLGGKATKSVIHFHLPTDSFRLKGSKSKNKSKA